MTKQEELQLEPQVGHLDRRLQRPTVRAAINEHPQMSRRNKAVKSGKTKTSPTESPYKFPVQLPLLAARYS